MSESAQSAKIDFQNLSPDHILDAVESCGYICDGHLLGLNSYENRVYQVGIEDQQPLIAKFYRPQRWSDACIAEEHEFAFELAQAEVPIVPPIKNSLGESLYHHQSFRFALFTRHGGYALELDNLDQLYQVGQFLGRIHAVGKTKSFIHRPELTIQTFAIEARDYLLAHDFIPMELKTAYRTLTDELIKLIKSCYERAGKIQIIRLHGDFHPSNILIRDGKLHIVDLDDARSGPAIQDLWLCLCGSRADQTNALSELLDGYSQFCDFNLHELHLIEAQRTLRLIYYYAWLAKRWDDPAFPRAFPWFNSQQCWESHILSLREQAYLMTEEPLGSVA